MTTVAAEAASPLGAGAFAPFEQATAEWADLATRLGAAWSDATLLRAVTLLMILAMTAAGCEILYWCYAMPAFRAIEANEPNSPARRAALGAQRLLLKLFGIAIGVAALYGATMLLAWPEQVASVALLAALALGAFRVTAALSDLVVSPRRASFRLWPGGDREARVLDRRTRLVAGLAAAGFFVADGLESALGAPALGGIAQDAAGVLVALTLLRAIGDGSRQRRGDIARRRRSLRDLVPFGLVVLVLASLALWLAGQHQLVFTVAIVAAFALADRATGIVLHAVLPPADQAGLPSTAAAYEPVIRRLIRAALAILSFIGALAIWHVNVLMQAASDGVAARVLAQAINVAAVILLCDLAWTWIKTFIARQLPASPAREGEVASRLSTLLPMIRTSVLIILVGLVTLVALSAMGVNIAPLLAGAGVVGLAIGFGAQTLVRDVITGVFFLIEDAFRVGEYIDVGTRKGTVEAISLRSLRLRHQRGALHTVPFGEIKSLSNESRDWSIVKLEFKIPFDTDLAKVKKIIKVINAEISADPELGPHLIEPIKSQGINRLEEYWMVLRVKFTAKPNSHQFMIRREAYQRIRDAFAGAGIRLGERSVKVEVAGGGGDAAAAGAIDMPEGEPAPPSA